MKPITTSDRLSADAEKELFQFLEKTVFFPIFELFQISEKERNNDAGSLLPYLMSGRIAYIDGKFTGIFSAAISKELRRQGAKFNAKSKSFSLPWDKMPAALKRVVNSAKMANDELKNRLLSKLSELQKMQLPDRLPFSSSKIFVNIDVQFLKIAKEYNLPMWKTPAMTEKLAEDYSTNLNLYIKKWRAESIFRLRDRVEKNVSEGFRADKLRNEIMIEYGVSKRKATFLAKQETSLLSSKYRQERFTDAGVQKYVWSTSHDTRVRPDHKALNGKVFFFSSPPVVDRRTGRTANPGEDYGCRCVPLPVIPRQALSKQDIFKPVEDPQGAVLVG